MSISPTKPNIAALHAAVVESDYLLIVAAAGLSISTTQPNNPYHSDADFARHYPRMVKDFGYRNSFMAMGLGQDPSVPASVKAAFGAHHFLNMTENFPPTAGYTALRKMALEKRGSAGEENVFCWTSNVDRCFARSGFPVSRVYTSQGEMNKMQCLRCKTIWLCTENLHRIVAASGSLQQMELTDMNLANKCPKCGQADQVMPSLRGGNWFDHSPYLPQQEELVKFMSKVVDAGGRASGAVDCAPTFTVVEIGVGPNTPVVTALPASRFAAAAALNGVQVQYIRINPDQRCNDFAGNPQQAFEGIREKFGGQQTAGGLTYTLLPSTWEVLVDMAKQGEMAGDDAQREQQVDIKEGVVAAQPERITSEKVQFPGNDATSGGAQRVFQSALQMLYQLR